MQDAQKVVVALKKDLRGVNKELVDVVKELDETIARHLARAERENATVYLQVRCPLLRCRGPQRSAPSAVASRRIVTRHARAVAPWHHANCLSWSRSK